LIRRESINGTLSSSKPWVIICIKDAKFIIFLGLDFDPGGGYKCRQKEKRGGKATRQRWRETDTSAVAGKTGMSTVEGNRHVSDGGN
jgi:hypothetical protein